jgi:hypothetical protein
MTHLAFLAATVLAALGTAGFATALCAAPALPGFVNLPAETVAVPVAHREAHRHTMGHGHMRQHHKMRHRHNHHDRHHSQPMNRHRQM